MTDRQFRYRHRAISILVSDEELALLQDLCGLLNLSRREVIVDGLHRVSRSARVKRLRREAWEARHDGAQEDMP